MSFTCPRCLKTSHNPNDEREGYCGACHDWVAPGRDIDDRTLFNRFSSRIAHLANTRDLDPETAFALGWMVGMARKALPSR